MFQFFMMVSRQGKVRLTKWYNTFSRKEQIRIVKDVASQCISRRGKVCNFLEWKEFKLVYKRYASLYFIACVDKDDNELITLEIIHHLVEILDRYFGNVCELDLIFNVHKAYWILDELVSAGELQETSKKIVLRMAAHQDALQDNPDDKVKEL